MSGKVTPAQLRVLRAIDGGGWREHWTIAQRIRDGRPFSGYTEHHGTLRRLVVNGLAEHEKRKGLANMTVGHWRITDAGRAALDAAP